MVNEAYVIDEKKGKYPQKKGRSHSKLYLRARSLWRISKQRHTYHMTHTLRTIMYSSVVTRETVCIALPMTVLHDLEVKGADILNAYVMVSNHEMIWTALGSEFGDDAGKSAVVVRGLYGLKSAGASFRAHLAQCMWELGYCSCNADSDLWRKAQYRPEDKLEYYSYILYYVDDTLCIHHDPDDVLNKLNGYVPLKPGSVRSPDMYLGMKLNCI